MYRRWFPSVVLLILFLGATGYLGAYAALEYWRARVVQRLVADVFSREAYPPSAAKLAEAIPDLEREVGRLGGTRLRLMYLDLLVLRAIYHPDDSISDLRRALAISQELFGTEEWADSMLVYQLGRAYLVACLPAKLERWQALALATEPQSREDVRYMQVYGRILADDAGGARSLIEQELAQRGTQPGTKMLALSGYVALDDIEEAAAVAAEIGQTEWLDRPFRYAYSAYLLESAQFVPAAVELRGAAGSAADDPKTIDPDDALLLATALAGAHGLDGEEVPPLLERATQSTRNPLSRPAAEAWAVGALFEITGEQNWWERLLRLRAEQPQDCGIALALASASLAADNKHGTEHESHVDSTGGDQPEVAAASVTRSADYANEALALAASDHERQQAWLLLARALARGDHGANAAGAAARESLMCLRRALGCPAAADTVNSERVPDYDRFLLDKHVSALRASDPDYDEGVHRYVVDYLNRRQELFAGVISLREIPYASGTAAPPSAAEPPDGDERASAEPAAP